ncbi:MAG: hypothetical protein JXA18_08300 [Chitinispirillaceae bacterium]|nr:hypothetical protein [Chitinispirillaceae bacterium]
MKNRRMNRNRTVWIAVGVLCLVSQPFSQNSLTLSIDRATDTIHRDVYGGLMEDWGRDIYGGIYVGTTSSIPNTNGMRNDIIEALKECRIGVLQFPGGCKSEVYHWKDGVGSKSSRPGGEKVNGMGTDEYFQLCDLVDCAPFIQVNCKEGTPAEMKAWLDYINTNFPNKLKYLGIGNEPWGGCYPGISVTEYLDKWYDPFNAAIPAAFANKLVRIIAAGSFENMSWHRTVVQRGVGNAEGLSWHYYTTISWTEGQKGSSFDFTESEYYTILSKAYAIEGYIKQVEAILDQYDPDNTIGLQPDEWGAWYNQISGMGTSYQQSTVRDALITAQHLNLFNNHCKRIRMAQQAQPVNAIHALFLTDPSSGALIKTPTYYVYKMYVPHHNARMVPIALTCGKVNNLSVLNASASVDGAGTLHISIGNIHATAPQTLRITLNGGPAYTKVTGQTVNGAKITSYNDYNKEEEVTIKDFAPSNYTLSGTTLEATLPAHSVVMLALSPGTDVGNRAAGPDRAFSIDRAAGGGLRLYGCATADNIPVRIALCGLDGRIIDEISGIALKPERGSAVWRPNDRFGAGVYVVKIAAGGETKSLRTLFIHQ